MSHNISYKYKYWVPNDLIVTFFVALNDYYECFGQISALLGMF